MAIINANIGLAANYLDDREVKKADFVDRVENVDSPDVTEVAYDRGGGLSSLIVFVEDQLSDYEAQDDPDEAFEQALNEGMNRVANWLNIQESSLFDDMSEKGLTVWVFIELWIEDDQLDLSFPPKLLAECGRLNISINMVTND